MGQRRSPTPPGASPSRAGFTIYDLARRLARRHSRGLITIDWRLSRATFGISIGERRGTGLGTEATRLTLDWAFHILGLQNVMLTVLPSNAGAIRVYEKAGFKRIGAAPRTPLVLHGPSAATRSSWTPWPSEFESPGARRAPLSYSRRSSRSFAQRGSGADRGGARARRC